MEKRPSVFHASEFIDTSSHLKSHFRFLWWQISTDILHRNKIPWGPQWCLRTCWESEVGAISSYKSRWPSMMGGENPPPSPWDTQLQKPPRPQGPWDPWGLPAPKSPHRPSSPWVSQPPRSPSSRNPPDSKASRSPEAPRTPSLQGPQPPSLPQPPMSPSPRGPTTGLELLKLYGSPSQVCSVIECASRVVSDVTTF